MIDWTPFKLVLEVDKDIQKKKYKHKPHFNRLYPICHLRQTKTRVKANIQRTFVSFFILPRLPTPIYLLQFYFINIIFLNSTKKTPKQVYKFEEKNAFQYFLFLKKTIL